MQVLLVEDEPCVSSTLKEGLEEFSDTKVRCVDTGQGAHEVLDACASIDLAVIDLQLPDISGFEVARMASALAVPVILISGAWDQQLLGSVCQYPMLTKPFLPSTLLEKAQQVMGDVEENVRRIRLSYRLLLESRQRNAFIREQADLTSDGG